MSTNDKDLMIAAIAEMLGAIALTGPTVHLLRYVLL